MTPHCIALLHTALSQPGHSLVACNVSVSVHFQVSPRCVTLWHTCLSQSGHNLRDSNASCFVLFCHSSHGICLLVRVRSHLGCVQRQRAVFRLVEFEQACCHVSKQPSEHHRTPSLCHDWTEDPALVTAFDKTCVHDVASMAVKIGYIPTNTTGMHAIVWL